MKIKKHNNKYNQLALGILAILLAVAGIYYIYSVKRVANTQIDAPKSNASTATSPVATVSDKQKTLNTDTPPQPNPPSQASKRNITVQSTAKVVDSTIYIRGGVNYPVEGGTCFAILTGPSGQSLRKETQVLQNPASADCKTIVIPGSDLSAGTWKYTLHYTSDNYEGTSDESTFTY